MANPLNVCAVTDENMTPALLDCKQTEKQKTERERGRKTKNGKKKKRKNNI